MGKHNDTQRFSKFTKLKMVCDTFKLKEEDLGRYLRANGIRSTELEMWRKTMIDAMDEGRPVEKSEKKKLNNRIELLENENAILLKKLEEANILIDLQKKVQTALDESAAGNTTKKSEKASSK